MEVTGSQNTRTLSFTILIAALAAMAGGLAVQTFLVARAVGGSMDDQARSLLAKLAWLSTVLLALAVVLLFWTVARFLRWRVRPEARQGPTQYVDAWSLAGQRFQLKEEGNPPTDDQKDQDQGGDSG